jgi:hypothetical protein
MMIRLARVAAIGAAVLALAGSAVAAQEATPAPLSPVPAEYYELRGPGLLVTVEAPAIADVLPTLHIEYTYYPTPAPGEPPVDFPQRFEFDGPPEQIQAFPGRDGNGALLTVTVEAVPDYGSATMSILLPKVNLVEESAPIETIAILTAHPTTIGGPELVAGPLQTYQVVPLSGSVRQVGP